MHVGVVNFFFKYYDQIWKGLELAGKWRNPVGLTLVQPRLLLAAKFALAELNDNGQEESIKGAWDDKLESHLVHAFIAIVD